MTLMACARSSRKPHSALPFVSLLAAAVGITLYPSESRATQTCTASVRAELGGDSSCVVDVSYELSTPCPPSGGGGGGYSVSLMAGTGQPDPACLGTPCAPGNSLSPGTTHVSGTSRWIFSEPQYVRFSFHAQGGGQYCGDGFTCTVESAPLVVCNGTVFKPAQGAIEYHHVDALGSTRMVTDANGAVVARYDYLPFGEEIPSGEWQRTDTLHYGGANNVLQRFTGQIRDDESGLDYFGARYFSSQQGRFMSPDPVLNLTPTIMDPQRWNRYAYVRNNPLRFTDPTGQDLLDKLEGAFNAFVGDMVPIPGVRCTDCVNPDFVAGQQIGDKAAQIVGAAEVATSLVGLGGEGALSLVPGGQVALAAAPATALLGVHGLVAGGVATYNLSKNNADLGSIYKVPGSATQSGKPYIGRHNKPDPAKTRRSRDGRDRTNAEVVDTYDASDVQEGRVKEQGKIDEHGLENLDNKRNEIRKRRPDEQ